MKDDDILEAFITMIKNISIYPKCVQKNVIDNIITFYDVPCQKQQYPKNIYNCVEFALQFYKHYNYEYYKILINELKNKNIIISKKVKKSCVDTENNKAYIRLYGDDSDLFMLVHEFAHFIDINLDPKVTPDKYNVLCEIFSFYMERQLEQYLLKQNPKYNELISIRNNNRTYYETTFMKCIKIYLYYEELYKTQGKLIKEQIDINDAKILLKYNSTNIVNFLLRYPIGNLFSEYIIRYNLLEEDSKICEVCLQIDLIKILEETTIKKIKHKIK